MRNWPQRFILQPPLFVKYILNYIDRSFPQFYSKTLKNNKTMRFHFFHKNISRLNTQLTICHYKRLCRRASPTHPFFSVFHLHPLFFGLPSSPHFFGHPPLVIKRYFARPHSPPVHSDKVIFCVK